ncbi:MAG: SEC-C metal-binding domain-containing protein [Anaerovoracaceae bacterium]
MSLYKQWQDLMDSQTDDTFEEFWKEYSSTEKRIYSGLLDAPTEKFQGKISDLIAKYEANPVIFLGFLDGITGSINNSLDLESLTEESEISLDVDLEKLFYNMLVADAEYLYTLPQWETILSEEKIAEIVKAYKRSKIVVNENKVGRNEPCPCGSGKKYKHCCGKN